MLEVAAAWDPRMVPSLPVWATGLGTDSPAALVLHFVLTLFHAIEHVAALSQRAALKVVVLVHPPPEGYTSGQVAYMGPEKELDALLLFQELQWLLPNTEVGAHPGPLGA